jgi:putative transcription antitermination factor YqgF
MPTNNHESDQIKHPQPLSDSDKDLGMHNDSIAEIERKELGKYLGIDYGKSDVGLALADEETEIAFVYKTIKNDKNFLQNLAEIIKKENVKTIIIGVPSYINRENVEYDAEKLGKLIEKNLKTEVEYQNEMFTTKMAQANLIERHVKGIKRFDDQEAARIILQEWLDNN